MPQQLYNEGIEYEDGKSLCLPRFITYNYYNVGTPATVSQMAKDVCVFLRWASGKFVTNRCIMDEWLNKMDEWLNIMDE